MEAGLDSLGAVDLRNALAAQFSVDLPTTVTFDYATVPALARFITSLILPHPHGPSSTAETVATPSIQAIRHDPQIFQVTFKLLVTKRSRQGLCSHSTCHAKTMLMQPGWPHRLMKGGRGEE